MILWVYFYFSLCNVGCCFFVLWWEATTKKLYTCLTLCSSSVSVHSDLLSNRPMSLLIPHPPMYPCPSVSTLLPLALSATQTPVLISPCMPASPRPLTPIKPHCVPFFFFFSGLVVFHDLSWFACTHLTGLLSQWLSRVTNSDLLQTRFKHLCSILISLITHFHFTST